MMNPSNDRGDDMIDNEEIRTRLAEILSNLIREVSLLEELQPASNLFNEALTAILQLISEVRGEGQEQGMRQNTAIIKRKLLEARIDEIHKLGESMLTQKGLMWVIARNQELKADLTTQAGKDV